ncbi:diaminopimelate epimerase [Candidatus Planktophila sulfonica]|uniref:Diaminopimelate epimerase n=1 Tax=Candidatus Planktophila sulfonica TaxID=1884904 RepID=A0A249KH03_9ACTN|nr:diaminopimelate epimerase [Candidatus Planktophila sulfonica]ASY16093.1 diaminopimelate epimerase [Candidatus Planktophila sulfonica]
MTKPVIGTYGHGTENDFVLVYDPENSFTISEAQISAICNRSTGIGADGFIRITKADGKWFMDYRNADGSIAEMCGNGIRVMAKYLVTRDIQPEGIFAIDTRAGIKHLRVPRDGDISVNMGHVTDEMEEIEVSNNGHTWSGYNINVGNPHAVVFVDSMDDIGSFIGAPAVSPASSYPQGVNVEFVEILPNFEAKMRVHERGSGETRSCGTGTCAVALAATLKTNGKLPSRWTIYPPGGRLIVDIDGHSNATLTGPAVILEDHDLTKYLS